MIISGYGSGTGRGNGYNAGFGPGLGLNKTPSNQPIVYGLDFSKDYNSAMITLGL